jgi:hypothetical protein|tara:strand:+ start:12926 stop:13069 length:144 start_codon:yes stop_codon:yes gene_type:complete
MAARGLTPGAAFSLRSSDDEKCGALFCSLRGRVWRFHNQPEHEWLLD